ncbi:MAG: ribosome small subunit-dependent GTPase A [Clostridia bacterium]|nr:ribosome small subunit-dependent GTPase A [Clostridia bacterium]
MKTILDTYGYRAFFDTDENTENIGRVTAAFLNKARVMTEKGEMECDFSRSLDAPGRFGGVCAGDWVRVSEIPCGMRIEEIFDRRTHIVRKASGPNDYEQVVSANNELTLIMTSMNKDFNLSRLERYLAAVLPGGSQPVIVLTKMDLVDSPADLIRKAEGISLGAPVFAVSTVTGEGMAEIADFMRYQTSALIGMSGVGKSSFVNYLSGGEKMKVNAIREDDSRGRHTTTHRELIALDGGIILIDTPGMREMALWSSGGVEDVYEDIALLAEGCRFRDCRHQAEPGCKVREAVEAGILDKRRLRNFLLLQVEDVRAASREKRKMISKYARATRKKGGD